MNQSQFLFYFNYSIKVVKSMKRFVDTVSTLAFRQPVIVSVDLGSIRGCATLTISDKCDAMINLNGRID